MSYFLHRHFNGCQERFIKAVISDTLSILSFGCQMKLHVHWQNREKFSLLKLWGLEKFMELHSAEILSWKKPFSTSVSCLNTALSEQTDDANHHHEDDFTHPHCVFLFVYCFVYCLKQLAFVFVLSWIMQLASWDWWSLTSSSFIHMLIYSFIYASIPLPGGMRYLRTPPMCQQGSFVPFYLTVGFLLPADGLKF